MKSSQPSRLILAAATGLLLATGAAFAEVSTASALVDGEGVVENDDPLAFLEGPVDCGRVESKVRGRYGLGVDNEGALKPLLKEEFRFVKEESCTGEKFASCSFSWCGGSRLAERALPTREQAAKLLPESAEPDRAPPTKLAAAKLEAPKPDISVDAGAVEPREAVPAKAPVRARIDELDELLAREVAALDARSSARKTGETRNEVRATADVLSGEARAAAKPAADIGSRALLGSDFGSIDVKQPSPRAQGGARAGWAELEKDDIQALIPEGTRGVVRRDGVFVPVPFETKADDGKTSLAKLDGAPTSAAAEPAPGRTTARGAVSSTALPAVPLGAAIAPVAARAPQIPSRIVPLVGGDAEIRKAAERKLEEIVKTQREKTGVLIDFKKKDEARSSIAWKVIQVPGSERREVGGGSPTDGTHAIKGASTNGFGRSIVPGIGRDGSHGSIAVGANGVVMLPNGQVVNLNATRLPPSALQAMPGGYPPQPNVMDVGIPMVDGMQNVRTGPVPVPQKYFEGGR